MSGERKLSALSRSNQIEQSPMISNGSKFKIKKQSVQNSESYDYDKNPYGKKKINDGIKLPKLKDNN